MQKYSIFNLVKNAFSGQQNWDLAWKDPTPKKEYDVVIIGGGGHGLATAYYLAKEHNITNVAIIEKGWIGGGNVGRNTTIIRSKKCIVIMHVVRSYNGVISSNITFTNPTFFNDSNIRNIVFFCKIVSSS